MNNKGNGVFIKEEMDFEPTLKKNEKDKKNKKGEKNGKNKKKVNGKDIS